MVRITHFSLKQKCAMIWWMNEKYRTCDAIICDGAVRSGKTLCMTIGFFLWATASFSDGQFALCGKTISSLRRNVIAEVVPLLRTLGFVCEEKRSENLALS